MKKKVTAILLTLAMMAVMAAGCGKERSESGGAAAENRRIGGRGDCGRREPDAGY